jgi:hypothetical protein
VIRQSKDLAEGHGAEEVPGRKQALSARGVQARGKALRTRHTNGVVVRKKGFKKRPRGFK